MWRFAVAALVLVKANGAAAQLKGEALRLCRQHARAHTTGFLTRKRDWLASNFWGEFLGQQFLRVTEILKDY